MEDRTQSTENLWNLEKMFKHLLPLIIALNELLTMDI